MIKSTVWISQLRSGVIVGILLFSACLAALAGMAQSTDPAIAIENINDLGRYPSPSGEQAILEGNVTAALIKAMDQWVDNPGSDDAKKACLAVAKQLSTQGNPSVDGCYNAVQAFEVLGDTPNAVTVLQRLIAEKGDISIGGSPVGLGGRLWLARLMEEQGQDDEALKLITEAEEEMKKLGCPEENQKYCRLLRSELQQKKGNKAGADRELQGVLGGSEKSGKPADASSDNFYNNYVKTRGRSISEITANPNNLMRMRYQMILIGYIVPAPDNLLGEKRAILWDKRYEKAKKSCFQYNLKMLTIHMPLLNPTSEIAAKELAALVKEDPYLAPLAEVNRALQADRLGKTIESDAIFEHMKQTWKDHASIVDEIQSSLKEGKRRAQKAQEGLQEAMKQEQLLEKMLEQQEQEELKELEKQRLLHEKMRQNKP